MTEKQDSPGRTVSIGWEGAALEVARFIRRYGTPADLAALTRHLQGWWSQKKRRAPFFRGAPSACRTSATAARKPHRPRS